MTLKNSGEEVFAIGVEDGPLRQHCLKWRVRKSGGLSRVGIKGNQRNRSFARKTWWPAKKSASHIDCGNQLPIRADRQPFGIIARHNLSDTLMPAIGVKPGDPERSIRTLPQWQLP